MVDVIGGVLGGVLGTAAQPLPPTTGKSARIRVGGRVRPPKAIIQVRISAHPECPPLAKQAHMQGHVLIDAILDAQGKVVAVQMIVTITFVLGE